MVVEILGNKVLEIPSIDTTVRSEGTSFGFTEL